MTPQKYRVHSSRTGAILEGSVTRSLVEKSRGKDGPHVFARLSHGAWWVTTGGHKGAKLVFVMNAPVESKPCPKVENQ